ncbi:LCP family protein [Alkalicella caledoniensis]|uniref:LCP family protein n=1 Tax=Alkalicella caledoniensis TaxID=2731377 RepID=A0A7G9WAW0_ALKCA|nr:LCP family protein [Alkalicella caledoniensis]QNO15822.1 LCP family protein [Alkalicella caledoniensis]
MKNNMKNLIILIMILTMVMGLSSNMTYAQQNNGDTEETVQTVEEENEPDTDENEEEEVEPAKGFVSVRYVDESGSNISEITVKELGLGKHYIESKTIAGYELISPITQSVTLEEAGQQKEIVFQYKKQQPEPQPAPAPDPVDETDTEENQPEPEPEPEAAVEGITMVAQPYKTTYRIGEEINLDGLVIYRELSNGEEEEVPLEELTVTGFNSEEAQEDQLVTISYNGYTAEFTVTIEEGESRGFFARVLPMVLAIIVIALLAVGTVVLVKRNKNKKTEKQDKPKDKITKAQKRKRIIIITAIVLALLLVVGYVTALYLLGRMEREKIPQDDDSLGIEKGTGVKGITNIAIFGIDSEDGMKGRSDSIMILTLDEKNDKIKITSIARDSYVDIPGRKMDKINHAYAFGGPELAIKTINQNFGLDIRHFVSVNFTSMPAIIDAVGGVEVKITDREAREVPGINSGGTHLLNGQQALRFSRIRKIDSDFERSRRQRDVMESVIKAAFKTPVTSYPGMLNKVLPHLTTNLTSNQILSMGGRAVMNNISTIEQVQFPPASIAKGQIVNGVWYYVFDLNEGSKKLSEYIFQDIPIN